MNREPLVSERKLLTTKLRALKPLSYTPSLEWSLCDYSDAYILVTENIIVVGGDNNTEVALKNYAPFRKCRTEINHTFIDEAEHFHIAIPMCDLIEYKDNYSDTLGSLC